jgi:hypothetical protein
VGGLLIGGDRLTGLDWTHKYPPIAAALKKLAIGNAYMTESCVGSARTGRPRSNMHCLTMLMMGSIADNMAMPPAVRERHEKPRAKFREVVEEAAFYGQPHSELVREAYRVCRFRLRSVGCGHVPGFALDSPLEERRFEPLVPPTTKTLFRTSYNYSTLLGCTLCEKRSTPARRVE